MTRWIVRSSLRLTAAVLVAAVAVIVLGILQLRHASVDTTRPDVEMWLVEGLPNLSLLHAAGNADLLVVGSRGYGGWKGLLMGSVSAQCVTQAPCPVAVVRNGEPSDAS